MLETQPESVGLKYRKDIDGLRAVAVLLVLLDHLQTRFTGGYVGVDVFFVISGYLISATILSEVRAGTFSIATFYERRVRRIAPALLVMLAASSVAAYLFLLPDELREFGKSALAAIGSVSNILFWTQAGYFDAPSVQKPLLHTWSLAVEEQFYVVFPLLIVGLVQWRRVSVRAAVWTLTAVSFVAACWCVRRSASTAFFWSPLRAWELLLGTLLSQRYVPRPAKAWQRELAAAGGLGLILVPAFLYAATTVFPGMAAVPACVGAGLIIAAGETGRSAVGRLLSWRPVVFVGLISYSLYLWHWPLIVLRNRALLRPDYDVLRTQEKVGLLVVSVLLGAASWRWIETPFRKGRWRPERRALFAVTGVATVALVAWMGVVVRTGGVPSRFPPPAVQAASWVGYVPPLRCFLYTKVRYKDFDRSDCLRNDPATGGNKRWLLVGDSLAERLGAALRVAYPEVQWSAATSADCRPFPQVEAGLGADFVPDCRALMKEVFEDYLPRRPVQAVLLTGSWQQSEMDELGRTIARIRGLGMEPVVLGPVPEYDTSFPRLVAFAERGHDAGLVRRHLLAESQRLDAVMAGLARTTWKVRYVSAFADLCPGGQCPEYVKPGVPMEFDYHHLTPDAAALYVNSMRAKGELPL